MLGVRWISFFGDGTFSGDIRSCLIGEIRKGTMREFAIVDIMEEYVYVIICTYDLNILIYTYI